MLEKKGVEVEEILVSGGTPEWDEMTLRTGGRTTPQILINDEVIGGYDELAVLNAQGLLDEKLGLEGGAARDVLYDVIIIATGKYPRPLGVPGEGRLLGKGVAYCATCDAPFYKDKVVAVVGGGNSALEAAGELHHWATKVYLIVRSGYTADDILVDRVTRMDKVTVYLDYETLEVIGDQQVRGIRLRSRADHDEQILDVDGVFVEVGLLPNTAFAMDVLALNEVGEILVDCQTQTGVPGVFAAGDATNVRDKQVIVAAGEGAKAALRAHEYLLTKR